MGREAKHTLVLQDSLVLGARAVVFGFCFALIPAMPPLWPKMSHRAADAWFRLSTTKVRIKLCISRAVIKVSLQTNASTKRVAIA